MGCSDVSEFEHIYGQILTTPSCVYGRLFTWTRMVDFNALIVWKTFIDICFSLKSSLWALTPAYTKFRRMIWSMIWSCGHRSRPSMCTVAVLPHSKFRLRNDLYCVGWGVKLYSLTHLIETPEDFTGEKLKAHNFVIFGWVKPLQVVKRNSGYDSHDATSSSSFPHLPSDFCPPPF